MKRIEHLSADFNDPHKAFVKKLLTEIRALRKVAEAAESGMKSEANHNPMAPEPHWQNLYEALESWRSGNGK